ncbi:putative quinol monooxygenase [Nocardioides lijunqiniae]|uniref:putative quinol monooxygenase n=1 Tax=Nocardioides lijunqiniae TaxID=2760832 RepID=UPI001878CDCD|nr:antibiotic biosynthesis monooxygenase [Nocardioides lijunqiniae]
MTAHYGFQSTMIAKPGLGDQLVELLLTGLEEGSPGATEHCLVFLVSRSLSNPDVAHVTEGWTTEEDHHRVFAGPAAQAMVAQFADLLAEEPTYTDYTPVNGKARF